MDDERIVSGMMSGGVPAIQYPCPRSLLKYYPLDQSDCLKGLQMNFDLFLMKTKFIFQPAKSKFKQGYLFCYCFAETFKKMYSLKLKDYQIQESLIIESIYYFLIWFISALIYVTFYCKSMNNWVYSLFSVAVVWTCLQIVIPKDILVSGKALPMAIPGKHVPDSKVHGANMGPTWVLSAPRGPHFGPMSLAIWVSHDNQKDLQIEIIQYWKYWKLGLCVCLVGLYTFVFRDSNSSKFWSPSRPLWNGPRLNSDNKVCYRRDKQIFTVFFFQIPYLWWFAPKNTFHIAYCDKTSSYRDLLERKKTPNRCIRRLVIEVFKYFHGLNPADLNYILTQPSLKYDLKGSCSLNSVLLHIFSVLWLQVVEFVVLSCEEDIVTFKRNITRGVSQQTMNLSWNFLLSHIFAIRLPTICRKCARTWLSMAAELSNILMYTLSNI